MAVKENIAPLNGGFMIIAVVGFVVSFYKVYDYSKSWGVAFMIAFGMMFAASLYSMAHTVEESVLHPRHMKKR